MKVLAAIAVFSAIGTLAACQSDNSHYDGTSRFAGSSSFDVGNHEIPEKDKPVPGPGVPDPTPAPDLSASPGRA